MVTGVRVVFYDKVILFSFISFGYDPTEKEKIGGKGKKINNFRSNIFE